MPRYTLRTLLILLAVGPPVGAPLMVWGWREYSARRKAQLDVSAQVSYLGAEIDDQNTIGWGVEVLKVQAGSPAETGGLTSGDVITVLNGQQCRNLAEFDALLQTLPPESKLGMAVDRQGNSIFIATTLGKRPNRR